MVTPERLGRRDGLAALSLVAALLVAYLANGEILPGHDATANVYLAAEILETGSVTFSATRTPWMFHWRAETRDGPVRLRIFDLDLPVGGTPARELRARGALVPEPPYYLMPSSRSDPATGERLFVGTYGVGAAVAALPVLAAIRPLAGDLRRAPEWLWMGAKVAASLLAAAAAALIFLALRAWLPRGQALLLAAACGLGTPLWSTASQSLWQHAPDSFFLAGGILAMVRARGRAGPWALSGLAFALAAASRPSSALFGAVVAAWLLARDRRAMLAFAAGAAPVVVAVLAANLLLSGSVLRYAQMGHSQLALAKTGSADLWQGRPWVTLPGMLLSPSRGLLVFSPFLVLALPGAIRAWRRPGWEELRPLSVAVAAVLLLDSFWFDWWGGWSYGPRRLTDLVPALTVLAAPAMARAWEGWGRRTALLVAVAWSVALQILGVVAYDVDGWNGRREAGRVLDVDMPEHRARLWSVGDSQVAYHAANLAESRRRKHDAHLRWIESWRPRPR